METLTAIASVLKLSENQIKSYEEWACVYFVRFFAGRPRFVSKAAVAKVIRDRNTQLWVLEFPTSNGVNWHRTVWVAKLVGFDPKYIFQRQYIKGKSSINRRGNKDIEFVITEPGLYQDSDRSYFEVRWTEEGLRFCCFLARHQVETILHNTRPIPHYA